MKNLISIITTLTVFAGSAIADEGMWLLPLLEKLLLEPPPENPPPLETGIIYPPMCCFIKL